MPLNDDGDSIKGLGFVALYAAYLEEAVDGCLEVLCGVETENYARLLKRPTSNKIEWIRGKLAGLAPLPEELEDLPENLSIVIALLEERNSVIHGRVYVVQSVGDIRYSGRLGAPTQEVISEELYSLANDLIGACDPLKHASMFALPRLLAARVNPTP